MTRPLPRQIRPAALRGLACGLALAGLAACASQERDPAVSNLAVAPRAAPAVPAPGQTYVAPPPSPAVRDQAAIAAACRRDADRVITLRDRGQLMREDERDSRVGSQASIFSQRAETDRLGRIFERDRLAEQCVQENTRVPPQR